jgi:hypothetical protein
MLSDHSKRLQGCKRFAEVVAVPPTNERACVNRAAAAYDIQEEALITKTRKIIAASKSQAAPVRPFYPLALTLFSIDCPSQIAPDFFSSKAGLKTPGLVSKPAVNDASMRGHGRRLRRSGDRDL